MDRLTPDARAERERALIERTNGCALFRHRFGAEHAGCGCEECRHMARMGIFVEGTVEGRRGTRTPRRREG